VEGMEQGSRLTTHELRMVDSDVTFMDVHIPFVASLTGGAARVNWYSLVHRSTDFMEFFRPDALQGGGAAMVQESLVFECYKYV